MRKFVPECRAACRAANGARLPGRARIATGRARIATGRFAVPWVVRDAVRDINRAVARRWQAIDPLLPDPSSMPAGCAEPLVVNSDGGRTVGLGVCVHHHVPADSLNQTWGAADRFMLTPRLTGQDTYQAADA